MALEWVVVGYTAAAEAVMIILLTLPGLNSICWKPFKSVPKNRNAQETSVDFTNRSRTVPRMFESARKRPHGVPVCVSVPGEFPKRGTVVDWRFRATELISRNFVKCLGPDNQAKLR